MAFVPYHNEIENSSELEYSRNPEEYIIIEDNDNIFTVTLHLKDGNNDIKYNNTGINNITFNNVSLYYNTSNNYKYDVDSTSTRIEYSISTDGTKYKSASGRLLCRQECEHNISLTKIYHYQFIVKNINDITTNNLVFTNNSDTNARSLIQKQSNNTVINYYTTAISISLEINKAGYEKYNSGNISGTFGINSNSIINTTITPVTLEKEETQVTVHEYYFNILYNETQLSQNKYNITIDDKTQSDLKYYESQNNKIEYTIQFNSDIINYTSISGSLNATINNELNLDLYNITDIEYKFTIEVYDSNTNKLIKTINNDNCKINTEIPLGNANINNEYYIINDIDLGTYKITNNDIYNLLINNLSTIKIYKNLSEYTVNIEYNPIDINEITDKINVYKDKTDTEPLEYKIDYYITNENNNEIEETVKYNETIYINSKDENYSSKEVRVSIILENDDQYPIVLRKGKKQFSNETYCFPWYIDEINVHYQLRDKLTSNIKEFSEKIKTFIYDNKDCKSSEEKSLIKEGQNEANNVVEASKFYIRRKETIDNKPYNFVIPLYKQVYPNYMLFRNDDNSLINIHKYKNSYINILYRTDQNEYSNLNDNYNIDSNTISINSNEDITYNDGYNTLKFNSDCISNDINDNGISGSILICPNKYDNDQSSDEYKHKDVLGLKYNVIVNNENITGYNFNTEIGYVLYNTDGKYNYSFGDNKYTFSYNSIITTHNISDNNINDIYPNIKITNYNISVEKDKITISDYNLEGDNNYKTFNISYENTDDFIGISGQFDKTVYTYLYPEIIYNNSSFTYSNNGTISYSVKISDDNSDYNSNGFNDENLRNNTKEIKYIITSKKTDYNYNPNINYSDNDNHYKLENNNITYNGRISLENLDSGNSKIRYNFYKYNTQFNENDHPHIGNNSLTNQTNNDDYIFIKTEDNKYFSYIKRYISDNEQIKFYKDTNNINSPYYISDNIETIYNDNNTDRQISYSIEDKYGSEDFYYTNNNFTLTNKKVSNDYNILYFIYTLEKDNNIYMSSKKNFNTNLFINTIKYNNSPGYDTLSNILNSDFDEECKCINIENNILKKSTKIDSIIDQYKYTSNPIIEKRYDWDSQFSYSLVDFKNYLNTINLSDTINTILDSNFSKDNISDNIILSNYLNINSIENYNSRYIYTYEQGQYYSGYFRDYISDISLHTNELTYLDNAYTVLDKFNQNISQLCSNSNVQLSKLSSDNLSIKQFEEITIDENIINGQNKLDELLCINNYENNVVDLYNTYFGVNYTINDLKINTKINNNYTKQNNTYSDYIDIKNNIDSIKSNLFSFYTYTNLSSIPRQDDIVYELNNNSYSIVNDHNSINDENYNTYYIRNEVNSYFDKEIISKDISDFILSTDIYTYQYNGYYYEISRSVKENYDNNINELYSNEYSEENNLDNLNNIYNELYNVNDIETTYTYVKNYIYNQLNILNTSYSDDNSNINNYNSAINNINNIFIFNIKTNYNKINESLDEYKFYENISNNQKFYSIDDVFVQTNNINKISYFKTNFNDYYKTVNVYRLLFRAYLYNVYSSSDTNKTNIQKEILKNNSELFYNYWLNYIYVNKKHLTDEFYIKASGNQTININTNDIDSLLNRQYTLKCDKTSKTNIYYFDDDMYNSLINSNISIKYKINNDEPEFFNGVINYKENKTGKIKFSLYNRDLFIKDIDVINNNIRTYFDINNSDNSINLTITQGIKLLKLEFNIEINEIDISGTNYKFKLLYSIFNNETQYQPQEINIASHKIIKNINIPNNIQKSVYIISYRLKMYNKYNEEDYVYSKIYNKIFYYNEDIYEYKIENDSDKIKNDKIVDVKLLLDYNKNSNHTYFVGFAENNSNTNSIKFSYITKYNDSYYAPQLTGKFELGKSYPKYNFIDNNIKEVVKYE